ncbi:MAG TPA: TlyA family RNA methyltransferase [Thermodesulfobacteriota bacterium]
MARSDSSRPARRTRLDALLVERGLAPTRSKAQALILAGEVRVAGQPADKAGALVPADAEISLVGRAALRYVSRGGLKLEGALEDLRVPVAGRVALDVGASTGGFTDCLLQAGARRVYAVDVGRGQLAWRLRTDPRVVALEGWHINRLPPDAVPEPVDLATVDVSFISLEKVLPAIRAFLRPGGDLLALVKPQFEVGPEAVGKGGVVRDPALRRAAVDRVARAARAAGFEVVGEAESRLPGPRGNREVFLHLRRAD